MEVKQEFFSRETFVVRNGQKTNFWKDTWIGNVPLSIQYPSLFNIAENKNATVADVLNSVPINLSFQRNVLGTRRTTWLSLVERLMRVHLSNDEDTFNLTANGVFSVKTMYADMLNGQTRFLRKYLWKLKIPLKIKKLLWFMQRKELLKKDNLKKRNWNGCTKCVFCHSD